MLLAAASSAVVCTLVLLGLVPALRRHAVLDHPGERSSHAVPTPRGGGLAVVLGITIGASLVQRTAMSGLVLAAVAVAAAVGLVEDLRGVSIRWRLAAHVLAGALVLLAIGDRPGGVSWLGIGAVLLVLVVAVINAVNFMDGINGITSVTGVVAGAAFAWLGHRLDEQVLLVLAAATAGACLAFLPWNAPRARVFLGDVGSYGLGASLAAALCLSLSAGATPEASVAPLALYLADTGSVLVRRWRAGEPLGSPHRQHAYQRLIDTGLSHSTVSGVVLLTTAVVSVLGLFTLQAGPPARIALDVGAVAVLLAYLAAPARRRDRVRR